MALFRTKAKKAGDANPRELKSVLIARFSALGDVAMTIPVIYSACICYPDVRFTLITRQAMTSIFINRPENLDVAGVDLDDFKGIHGLWKLFRKLRREYRFDGFIDLHDVLRTKAIAAFCHLCAIPVSVINKGRKGKSALTRRRNKVLLPLISTRARYRQAFHRIGLPVENRFHGLFGHGTGPQEQFAQVTAPKPDGERWIGIAPFAKHSGKVYPADQTEQVLAELVALPAVRVFLFGGGDSERDLLQSWAERYPNTVNLAGKRFGFQAELALVSHLDVMISMDSANMHLASLVRTPVVSVWGATHPYCGFKGWRQKEDDMIQLPMTCRPCSVFGNKPCFRGDYHCLRGISPHSVLERVLTHLPPAGSPDT